jgi:lipopolysaccharide transport system ATP-binding protein
MRRSEIRRKFDDIVEFAEVARFIDTPVKRYSSGMYVRLAFAVAAHLEPEVLIVDEVLAVGDVAFQKKCLGKMGDVAREGRTVLFISHNVGAIERLCTRCVLIEGGKLVAEGSTVEVIKKYLRVGWRSVAEWRRLPSHAMGDAVGFQAVRTMNDQGEVAGFFKGDDTIRVELEYVIRRPLADCQVGVRINNEETTVLYTSDCDGRNVASTPRDAGTYSASFELPGQFLPPGTYSVVASAHSPGRELYEVLNEIVSFEVEPPGSLTRLDGRLGVVAPLLEWVVTKPAVATASTRS